MKIERRNKKGFTLIELMIVIAIIAILAAILVPNFLKARAQGQLTSCKSNVKNIGTACEMYSTDNNGRYPSNLEELTSSVSGGTYLLRTIPKCPTSNLVKSYEYGVRSNPDKYGVWCAEANHVPGGLNENCNKGYPQFDSSMGLIAPTPKDSVITADIT